MKFFSEIPVEYKYLGLLMLMPLFDGVFISIVLSGGLNTLTDSLIVGGFVLGGGATIGVILSEFERSKVTSIKIIIIMSLIVFCIALLQVILAPTIEPFIDTNKLQFGSMIALIVLAYNIYPKTKNYIFIKPGFVIIVTVLLSINIDNPDLNIILEFHTLLYVFIAIMTSALISICTVILRPYVINHILPNQIQSITAISLFFVALSIGGFIASIMPIIIFSIGLLLTVLLNAYN